jgi:hypothetical protein
MVVLVKIFEALAMEVLEKQGFAVEVCVDISLSLGSPPLYIGLGGPLAPPIPSL